MSYLLKTQASTEQLSFGNTIFINFSVVLCSNGFANAKIIASVHKMETEY